MGYDDLQELLVKLFTDQTDFVVFQGLEELRAWIPTETTGPTEGFEDNDVVYSVSDLAGGSRGSLHRWHFGGGRAGTTEVF